MIRQHLIRFSLTICVFSIIHDIVAQKPGVIVNSGHNEAVLSLDISSDNKYVVSGSVDNTIKLWDIARERLIRTLYHGDGEVFKVFFYEDNAQIISCGGNDTVRIWETQSGTLIRQFGFKAHNDRAVALSEYKKYIISSDE